MSPTTTAVHGSDRRRTSRPGQALLWSGVVITALSGIALLVILSLYFMQADPHPVFYGLALWGFPLGFALLVGFLLFSVNRRRRGTGIG
ncbi:hypothetical protein [Nesterenkonia sandarakina]|uniref:ABC-type uncharacterized transport system permease subunit n=1 Tax=Nesterenkonia sandarakina TaxID=272918 RepID=A0A7Z0J2T3_9MICC|nr:hypothetical protein [Nesterenkonia sandarakina]NYJ16043.1 ABC-type uncharacterized transport system permease subunit [Nesterenkonia sandarakina]